MRSRTRLAVPAASLAVLATAVTGCSNQTGDDAPDDEPTPSARAAPTTELGHVHGLGLNPGDGLIYVATHNGLFVVERESARPVGHGRQDTMGFTITGPNAFLASGHPAPGQDGPTNLGLLSSHDAGTTWRTVAEEGRDFHALTAAGEVVYGLDSSSGALMASADGGRTWQIRATVPARIVDVSPTEPQRLLATTEAGLMLSDDGGATFSEDTAQPPRLLVLVDHIPADGPASSEATVAGLDTTGKLWTFDGQAWTGPSVSVGGAPHAFTALGPDAYLAATETGIYRTDNAGRSWQQVPTRS